jgi:O-antigen/teichoic acid export membrane protein
MREFFKSFLSFGVATTIERLIAFLLLPIYTRYFTAVEFGIIDMTQVLLGVVTIFAVLQLETALQRYYYEYNGLRKRVFLSTIFISVFILSCVVTGIIILFSHQLSVALFKQSSFVYALKLAALQLPFINISMLSLVVLRYEKESLKFLVSIVLKVILNVGLTVIFVVVLNYGINGVLYAQLVSICISSALVLVYVRKSLLFHLSKKMINKSLRYALPQFPARMGSVILSYSNRFFMIGYLSMASVGIYSLSLKLASVVQMLYTAFVMAWAPFMFANLKKPGHKVVFSKILSLAAGPVFLLVCFISIFSKELLSILGSDEFMESYKYVGGLSLYFAMFIFKEVVDIGPKFTERTKYLSLNFFISVIVNVTSMFFFIQLYGLNGVVYSMILTNTVLVAISWFVSNKLYYIPFNVAKFIVLAAPAFYFAVASLYELPSITVRFGIFFLISTIYSGVFWKDFTTFNSQKI